MSDPTIFIQRYHRRKIGSHWFKFGVKTKGFSHYGCYYRAQEQFNKFYPDTPFNRVGTHMFVSRRDAELFIELVQHEQALAILAE